MSTPTIHIVDLYPGAPEMHEVVLLRDYEALHRKLNNAQQAAPPASALIESVAHAIYEQWADQPGFVPWVTGGNALKQCEARRIARAAIDAAPPAPEHPANAHLEWVDQVMTQAQVFASAWSLVGGRFDTGDGLEHAEEEKQRLREMLEAGQ